MRSVPFIVSVTLSLALTSGRARLTAQSVMPVPMVVAVADNSTPLRAFFPAAITAVPTPVTAAVRPVISVDVMVWGAAESLSAEGFVGNFTAADVEKSAGTFGDPSRFFGTLAGVINQNDQRNDFIVRGGNPAETLFVVDNIEVPSINQMALSDTTGGFASMIDEAAVRRLSLHDDAYSSRFEDRLSSVVEVTTHTNGSVERHSQSEMGISGVGGSMTRPLGPEGSYFASVRHSILQYVTDDIGLNGVPKYSNALLRAEGRVNSRNSWWGMSLTGIDSIDIHPAAGDPQETNPFDIAYRGWRNATGVNWQHVFSAHAYGVASAAHTEQSQSMTENGQLQAGDVVYNEQTRNGVSTLKYDWTFVPAASFTLQAGGRAAVDQLNYNVTQPIGLQNPYSSDPTPVNAGGFARRFATGSTAGYVEASKTLPHQVQLVVGERFSQWALGGRTASSAKAFVSAPLFGRAVHLSYSQHAQMPSQLYLLAFSNQRALLPIRSRQVTAGLMLFDRRRAHVRLEVYDKQYRDYPVAAGIPQLSLANVADTFGQAFLLFPMNSAGKGIARGVEATAEVPLNSRLSLTIAAAYSRNWFSGADSILRRGDYDIPLAVNVTGRWQMRQSMQFTWRYNVTSGRVYTPDNMPLSFAQNRDVYDLNRINGLRSDAYQRLDFRFEQTRKVGTSVVTWHAGLQNATNHDNFYSQVWEPRMKGIYLNPTAAQFPDGFQQVQNQMQLFPDGGLKVVF